VNRPDGKLSRRLETRRRSTGSGTSGPPCTWIVKDMSEMTSATRNWGRLIPGACRPRSVSSCDDKVAPTSIITSFVDPYSFSVNVDLDLQDMHGGGHTRRKDPPERG